MVVRAAVRVLYVADGKARQTQGPLQQRMETNREGLSGNSKSNGLLLAMDGCANGSATKREERMSVARLHNNDCTDCPKRLIELELINRSRFSSLE